MKIKKPIALVSAAALGFSLTGCTNYKELLENDQGKYISLAATDTVKALVKADDLGIAAQIASALESGAAYITVDTEDMDYSAYFSGSEKTAHQLIGLSMSSDKGTMDLRLSSDKQRLSAAITGPTSDYAYGVDYKTFAEKLDSSIFAVNSGTAFALDEDTVKEIKDAVNAAKEQINGAVTDSADNTDYSGYIDRIGITTATSEITVAEEAVKADIITYSIDSALFDDIMVDHYKKSYSVYYSEEEWEVFEKQLRDSFDANMSCSFNINSKTHLLMSVTFNGKILADGDSADIDGGLVFGVKPDKSDKISLYLNMTANGEASGYNADFFKGVKNGDTTAWNADYTISGNGETRTASSVLSFNKADGALVFTATDPEGKSVTANAAVTRTSDSAAITLNSIIGSDGENIMDGTVIGVKFTKAPIPAINADKDFMDITEEELKAMGETLDNDFLTVMGIDY